MTKTERKKLNKKSKDLDLLAMRLKDKASDMKGEMLKALFDQQLIEAELEIRGTINASLDGEDGLSESAKSDLTHSARYIATTVFNEVLHHMQGTTFGRFQEE